MAQAAPPIMLNSEVPLADVFAQVFRESKGQVHPEFTIMVLGRTGSGKSTFANFLLQTHEENQRDDDDDPEEIVERPDPYPPKSRGGIEPDVLDIGPFELVRRSFVSKAGTVGVTRFCRHITKMVQVPGDERRRVQFRVVDSPGIPDPKKVNSKIYVDRICQYLRTNRVHMLVHVLYSGREGANGLDLQRQWDRDAVLINHILTSLVDIPVVSMVSYRHGIEAADLRQNGRVKQARLAKVSKEAEDNMKETVGVLCNPGGAGAKPRIDKGCASVFYHTNHDLSRICIEGLVPPMLQASKRPSGLQQQLMTASELLEGYRDTERMHQLSVVQLQSTVAARDYAQDVVDNLNRDQESAGKIVGYTLFGVVTLGIGLLAVNSDLNRKREIIRNRRLEVFALEREIERQVNMDPGAKLAEVQRLIELWNNAA